VSVQNGRPYTGARGAALVLANGTTRQRCDTCGAETTFVLEDVASGPGLVAAYHAAGGHAGRAEDVLQAAKGGDARAKDVIALATLRLGQALALLAGALDPEAIILGGGLGSAEGPYFDALTQQIHAGLWPDDPRPLPVLRSALGPDAGLIGAALALSENLNQEPEHRPIAV
jgi:glucokinase